MMQEYFSGKKKILKSLYLLYFLICGTFSYFIFLKTGFSILLGLVCLCSIVGFVVFHDLLVLWIFKQSVIVATQTLLNEIRKYIRDNIILDCLEKEDISGIRYGELRDKIELIFDSIETPELKEFADLLADRKRFIREKEKK